MMDNRQPIFFFDLETVPTIDKSVHDSIAASIKPPATMSKADTIAKWEIEKKPEAVNDAILKTALDGSFGSIAVIGVALNDNDPIVFYEPNTRTPHDYESKILSEFFYFLQDSYAPSIMQPPIFAGHNIINFDLRFLFQRSIVLGIKPPSYIPFNAKPWDEHVHDNMVNWSGRDYISQDKLSKALGNRGKEGMDGSQVWPNICAGNIDAVANYCIDDVLDARANYKRMNFID